MTLLQAAVNGDRSKADHPAVPVTQDELIRDVQECLAAGAWEFHIHVRDADGNPKNDAIPMVDAIHEILGRADVKAPRLQHGDGELTWILIEDAVRRGLETRVRLEDTLYLPGGSRARNNADLVSARWLRS